MVIGFIFFFSTRLWNEDDRPRMNSYAVRSATTHEGSLHIYRAVYIEGLHELNLLVHETMFFGSERLMITTVVHNLDGTYYTPPTYLARETTHLNQIRSLVRIELDDEILDWYFVEVVILNENGPVDSLTIDWRLVEHKDDSLGHYLEDFFFEESDQGDQYGYSEAQPTESSYQYQYGHGHHHGEGEVDLERELRLAQRHLERLEGLLEEQPYNPIFIESVDYYLERIQYFEERIENEENSYD